MSATDGSTTTAPLSTTVASDGTWSIDGLDVSGLLDGQITFTADTTDGNNFTDETTQTATKVTISLTAETPNPITAVNQTAVQLNGTGEVDATVTLHVTDSNGGAIADQSTTVAGDGTWSFSNVDVTDLVDGDITFHITATDANSNSANYLLTVNKDTSVQVAIAPIADAIASANEQAFTVSGTADPDATLSIAASDGTITTISQAVTNNAGAWTINLDVSSLADGPITFTITATDGVGNSNSAMAQATKITATIQPVIDPITIAAAQSTAVSGTGEVGATMSVIASDGMHDTAPVMVTIAGDGTWSLNVDVSSLDDGLITYTATSTDAQNRTDTVTTSATKTTVAITSITPNPINAAGQTAVSISGTGEPLATVVVTLTDTSTGLITLPGTAIAANGTWSIDNIDVTALVDGTITATAVATDGNTNTAQTVTTVEKDTTVQVAITPIADPITSANEQAFTVSGTADADATLSIVASDGTTTTVSQAVTNNSGTWTADVDVSSLANGPITFTITATDSVGNSVDDSAGATKITLAAATPASIVIANSPAYSLSGTGEANASISLTATDELNNSIGPVTDTIGNDGTWTLSGIDLSTLVDGTITFTVTSTDGQPLTDTVTVTATKTTVAITSIAPNPINLAGQTAVSISGTGEPLATVVVTLTDTSTGLITLPGTAIGADGNWSIDNIDVSVLVDGTITVTAVATDGNMNTAQTVMTVEKDTINPSVAIQSVTDPIDGSNAANTEATGTCEIGATVSVMASDGTNNSVPVDAIVDGGGNWTASGIDVTGFDNGTITFTATATDAAGNTGTDTMNATASGLAIIFNPLSSPSWYTQTGDTVTINGTAGDDTFEFIAGAGVNTVIFNGNSQQFDANALNFIFSGGGGHDVATLVGSNGNDSASLTLGGGTLSGDGYRVSVAGVASLAVSGGGGTDTATLDDSVLDDLLVAAGDELTLSNTDSLSTTLAGFSSVQAISSHGGTDTADVSTIDFSLEQVGDWLDG